MNKKGFTLIELLITIVLLSIISVISFVSINKVIERGQKNNCESLIKNIKTAASEYVSDNRYSTINSNKLTLTAQDLTTKKYLSSPIIDPYNNDKEIAASSIGITIDLNNDYTVKEVTVTGIECK